MNKYKKLAKNTTIFAISQFSSKVLNFFLVPLYTYVLSTSDYGSTDLVMTAVNLIYPAFTLLISEGILRFAFDKKYDQKIILRIGYLIITAGTIILLILGPLVNIISKNLYAFWPEFLLIYIGFNLEQCTSYYVRGIGYPKIAAIAGVIQTLAVISSNLVLLLYLHKGVEGYFISLMIGYYITLLFELIFLFSIKNKHQFKTDDNSIDIADFKQTLRDLLNYSVPYIPASLAWWVNTSADKYIIQGYYGLDERGIYAVAFKIPSIMVALVNIFLDAWKLSAFAEENKDDKSFFSEIYHGFEMISTMLCALLILCNRYITPIIFEKSYYNAVYYVPFLLLAFRMQSVAGFLASIFAKEKRTGLLNISILCGAVANIALNLVLVPKYGSFMAAITTAIGFCLVWAIRLKQSQNLIRMDINTGQVLISNAILIGMAVIDMVGAAGSWIICLLLFIILLGVYYKEIIRMHEMLIVRFRRK